jgi:hypothetical protein
VQSSTGTVIPLQGLFTYFKEAVLRKISSIQTYAFITTLLISSEGNALDRDKMISLANDLTLCYSYRTEIAGAGSCRDPNLLKSVVFVECQKFEQDLQDFWRIEFGTDAALNIIEQVRSHAVNRIINNILKQQLSNNCK